jgi:hypothetical protein
MLVARRKPLFFFVVQVLSCRSQVSSDTRAFTMRVHDMFSKQGSRHPACRRSYAEERNTTCTVRAHVSRAIAFAFFVVLGVADLIGRSWFIFSLGACLCLFTASVWWASLASRSCFACSVGRVTLAFSIRSTAGSSCLTLHRLRGSHSPSRVVLGSSLPCASLRETLLVSRHSRCFLPCGTFCVFERFVKDLPVRNQIPVRETERRRRTRTW